MMTTKEQTFDISTYINTLTDDNKQNFLNEIGAQLDFKDLAIIKKFC